MISEKNKKKFL